MQLHFHIQRLTQLENRRSQPVPALSEPRPLAASPPDAHLGNQAMELAKGPLAREPFGGHSQHQTQHGQTAIQELGGVVKSPSPLWAYHLHSRLNRPGIEQVGHIRAPPLIL